MRGDDEYGDFWGSRHRPFGRRGRFDGGFGNMDQIHEDMERQIEEMNRHMENVFRNFGRGIDFDHPRRFPAIEGSYSSRSPANDMLKEDAHTSYDVPAIPERYPRRSLFNRFLDSSDWDREAVPEGDGGNFSFSRSYSMSRVFDGNNKKLEERKTIRKPDGSEEVEITRNLNDKAHTIKTKIDKYGRQETDQFLENMNDAELSDFQRKWNETNSQPLPVDDVRGDELVPRERPRSFFDRFSLFRR